MITKQTTPGEVDAIKSAFKVELKALLLKYNAAFCADVQGDTHGLEYSAAIVLTVHNSQLEHVVIENKHGLSIDAGDCR